MSGFKKIVLGSVASGVVSHAQASGTPLAHPKVRSYAIGGQLVLTGVR